MILTEVERLTRLFQNILSMARIDAGSVAASLEWAVPSDIVAAAREQVEQTLRHHRVEVAIPSDAPVRLDPRLTATALAHVLENAAQYSPARSPIRVATSVLDGELHDRRARRGSGHLGGGPAARCSIASIEARRPQRALPARAWACRSPAACSRPSTGGSGRRMTRRAPRSRLRCPSNSGRHRAPDAS